MIFFANFIIKPALIAIRGRLMENIKEDIYANPNMPSLSSVKYSTCENGENTATAHKKSR